MLTRRFSLVELAAVMLVVAIVVYALFSRTLRYLEVAEKAAMTLSVFEVESGMRIRFAMAAGKGDSVPSEALLKTNPFEFAHAIPANYLGELGGQTDLQGLKPGNWFYDMDRREIAYLPRFASRFRGAPDAEIPVIRYRADVGGGKIAFPRLVSVVSYQWEPEFGTF